MKIIKTFLFTVMTTSLLSALPGVAEDRPEHSKKLCGDGLCAKCELKETDRCPTAIRVTEGDRKVVYYAKDNEVAKEFHPKICKSVEKVKAVGNVQEKDGKRHITLTQISLRESWFSASEAFRSLSTQRVASGQKIKNLKPPLTPVMTTQSNLKAVSRDPGTNAAVTALETGYSEKRVLVGIDFGNESWAVLRMAETWAAENGARMNGQLGQVKRVRPDRPWLPAPAGGCALSGGQNCGATAAATAPSAMKSNQTKQPNWEQDMRRMAIITLIVATLPLPGSLIAVGTAQMSAWAKSRKLVQVNRVDRVSTNADWIQIEWPTGSLSGLATLVPALTPIDAPAPATDFSPLVSEPTATATSTRVESRRPTLDPRSFGKRKRPS